MNIVVLREAYLEYAMRFTETEFQLIDMFNGWLPENIIDCHAHCNLPEHVLSVSKQAYLHMLSTFPSFSLQESKIWHDFFYPHKAIRTLRFAKTFRGIDHRAANQYLLKESPDKDRVALFGLPDDPDYTISMLYHPRVSALKMYYSYLEPPATEIYQYFPKVVLAEAEQLDIPIILHPPRCITLCLDQILQLLDDFPRLRVCIAHLGLTKSLVPGLKEAFTEIAKNRRVNFDTALVPSAEVVSLALKVIGVDRIMFGSDEPLNLIRSTTYQNPIYGQRLITEYLYHWVNSVEHQEFRHLAKGVTHSNWQSLCAIKDAVSKLPPREQRCVKKKLFCTNAESFYGF